MTDIAERAVFEIRELHRFFEDWFAGRVAESDDSFSRVERALGADFRLISPRGVVDDRASILSSIRAAYGKRTDMKLWTDTCSTRWLGPGACLVQYREHQTLAEETTVRHSSAFFVADAAAPNGLAWVHVHETWLPAEA